MRLPHVDDLIRLVRDIPELSLVRGKVGVVRSTWFSPTTAYEVEFQHDGAEHCTRTLLNLDQLQLADDGDETPAAVALKGTPAIPIHG